MYLQELNKANQTTSSGIAFLDKVREKGLERLADAEFPTNRTEDWRQVDLRPLTRNTFTHPAEGHSVTRDSLSAYLMEECVNSTIVFVNGRFDASLSDVSGLPEGVEVARFADLTEKHAEIAGKWLTKAAQYENDPFVPFNAAQLQDGVFVHVKKEINSEVPIHILNVNTSDQEDFFTTPRTLIVAERHSDITIVEDFVGLGKNRYFTGSVTESILGDESHITHVKIQRDSKNAIHISRTAAYQGRGSNYNSYTISIGAALFRNEPKALVDAENAHATLDGLVMVTDDQVSDTHSVMDHLKANCTSHQLHKVVALGNGKSVFNGKIFVRQDSQKIDAFQENRNLLLSQDAEVFTKPQLEIFADDVKCSHGATIGQLSQDEMFYLMSRGLSREASMEILTYGYALEVIENLPLKSVRDQLEKKISELTRPSETTAHIPG